MLSTAAISPPQQALAALSPSDVAFLHSLPKDELHVHLNGCIPFPILQRLARDQHAAASAAGADGLADDIKRGINQLEGGVTLERFQDFFALFPAIYYLTAEPPAIALVTSAVLSAFLDPVDSVRLNSANCQFLELRTTPRSDVRTGLTAKAYLETVLAALEAHNERAREAERKRATAAGVEARRDWGEARLIVSLDYRMDAETVDAVIRLATALRAAGRPIVGLDVCGDPTSPPSPALIQALTAARKAGWELTIHVAELESHDKVATRDLLNLGPRRIGHGTFLDAAGREKVRQLGAVVEVCLTSNVLCKTTATTADSHLHQYLDEEHPATICTDDTFPFATSLIAEYALLLAAPPLGLGMSRDRVAQVALNSVRGRFRCW